MGSTWGALVRLRNRLYDRAWLPIPDPPMPVVAVGNLTLGGTGKTPWVSYLLGSLSRPGRVLGVLTRGYGPSRDEARLLAARHPEIAIAIDPDRNRGARDLSRRGVTVAIADDAFQHRRLRRVADLLLLDARHPFGNERVLPAGMLREPVDAVRRATAVILTRFGEATEEERARLEKRLLSWLPGERMFRSNLEVASWWELRRSGEWATVAAEALEQDANAGAAERLLDLQRIAGAAVVAVCAIGNPASFHRTLRAHRLDVRHAIAHRDHHRFEERDLAEITEHALRLGVRWIACTEKDLYNLPSDWRPPVPLLVPRLRVSVDRPADLLALLESRLTL